MNPKVEQILSELKRYFASLYGDRLSQLILFGSQARGDFMEQSDIDLMVILKGSVNPVQEIKRTNPFIANLSLQYDEDISCLFMPEYRFLKEQTPLLINVRREGFAL